MSIGKCVNESLLFMAPGVTFHGVGKYRTLIVQNAKKKALADYYETAVKLEETQGIIVKLTAQVNHFVAEF